MHVPPAEGQELTGQVQATPGSGLDLAQQHPRGGILGVQDQQVGQPQDRRAHIVELVGQLSRQLRKGLDPLGPVDMFFTLPAAGHVLYHGVHRPPGLDRIPVDQDFQQQAVGHRHQAAPGTSSLADRLGRLGQGPDQGGHLAFRRDGGAASVLQRQDSGGFAVRKEAPVGLDPDRAERDLRAVAGKGVAHGGETFVGYRRRPFPAAGISRIHSSPGLCPGTDRSPCWKSAARCGRASSPSCEQANP